MPSATTYSLNISKHGRTLVSASNFHLEENKITFLFGESGIGKSLIAKSIYGLLNPEEFSITINGRKYGDYLKEKTTQEIQSSSFFVPQEPSTHLNPLLSIGEQLNEGSLAQQKAINDILTRLWNSSDTQAIKKLLNVYPKPYRPSGGEKQRLLLAMAFLKIELLHEMYGKERKTMFVFDEPTGSLDNRFRDIFLSFLFEKFQTSKFTILYITHDYSVISAIAVHHQKMHSHLCFKELALERNSLRLKNFEIEEYLKWLDNQRRSRVVAKDKSRNKILLNIQNDIEVYGRRLSITRRSSNGISCALELEKYSMIYLKGPSGTGKTTFAKSIMGLLPAKNLRVQINHLLLDEYTPKRVWQNEVWGKMMTIVFQHADEALNQNSTVKGTLEGIPRRKMASEEIQKMMKELFGHDTEEKFLNKKVCYLSGGQKQKLNLLRSLILDTDILILDEPFNGLDFASIVRVLEILREKQKEGMGILLISHNEDIFDRIVPEEDIYYLHAKNFS
jgi:peptide/nickel transport system ATP-binding protein